MTAESTRDVVQAAHQQLTREWWERRDRFDLFVSRTVLNEAAGGDAEAARRRLAALQGITVLAVTTEAAELAAQFVRAHAMPAKATVDALHVAIAVVNPRDFERSKRACVVAYMSRCTSRVQRTAPPMGRRLDRARTTMRACGVYDEQKERLTDAQLHAFFEGLFPHGWAGADVLADIAPEGWEQSPLLACFHPSLEQRYEEAVQLHRNLEELNRAMRRKDAPEREPRPEPTLDEIRSEYRAEPVNVQEEVTELIGLCLWDVFSDNHDVTAADGRVVDIGSFRGAGVFLDEHLDRDENHRWREGDYMRFYMGTIWISRRADLTSVYVMIFRRLRALGADWEYYFPQLYLTELAPRDQGVEQPATYSVSESAAAELKAQKRRAETARMRSDIDELNAQARERALDQETPATVRAYRQVFGRDPRGWPPG